MFTQPRDFRDESEALYRLIAAHGDSVFARRTRFRDWTIGDVVRHLHCWNRAADLSLRDPDAFAELKKKIVSGSARGESAREIEEGWHDGSTGRDLLERWRAFFTEMAERWAKADPKARVAWAGPDMSVRSSITARLMETWAHGQEVYDALGVERVDTDRIHGVAVLGVNTYGWTFANRGLELPGDPPHVRLTAPSGALWTWNEPSETSLVEGSATEFCQVVTQVRNVADTRLRIVGEPARRWMAIAQCFAGAPVEPPTPGSRRREA